MRSTAVPLVRGRYFLLSALKRDQGALSSSVHETEDGPGGTITTTSWSSSWSHLRSPRACRALTTMAMTPSLTHAIRPLTTEATADRSLRTDLREEDVHAVAVALQSILAAPARAGDPTRTVSRAHASQALAPLLLSLHRARKDAGPPPAHAAPSLSASAVDSLSWPAWQSAMLDRAWAASSTHFYWSSAASAAESVAVPCCWQAVVSQAALALPHEGVAETELVQALQHARLTTCPAAAARAHTGDDACELPAALEGSNGCLASWLHARFPELLRMTRSVRTGQTLYRCTPPQQWLLRATTSALAPSASAGDLRGPEYHHLVSLHAALERVHGAGAADLPVWAALRELTPHLPSSMVCPSLEEPHAWVRLLSAPSLRPHLSVQSRVGVRARQRIDPVTTAGADGTMTSTRADRAAEDTTIHAEQATPAPSPLFLCVDVTSFLPASTVRTTAAASQSAALDAAVHAAACCVDALPVDGSGPRSALHVLALTTPHVNHALLQSRLVSLVRAKWPQLPLVYTPVEVDLDGFLGSEHVLGATLSQLGLRVSPQQRGGDATTVPDVSVVCGADKVPAIRAVLASLLPGEVTFHVPASDL